MSSSQQRPQLSTGQNVQQKWRVNNTIMFTALMVIFVVALIFAANNNEIIGWLIVIIAAGWLILAAIVAFTVNRGAKAVSNRFKDMRADVAGMQQQSGPAPVEVIAEHDQVRDMKLDHSFKIIQVQARVMEEEMAKGTDRDQEMINRALDTINITASNARDLIKDSDDGDAVSGEVIN